MNDDQNLVTVATRSSEVEATVLVSVLADAGIRAVATGGFTAGFRAEAPGWVRVQTLDQDADRARQVLSEIEPLPHDTGLFDDQHPADADGSDKLHP